MEDLQRVSAFADRDVVEVYTEGAIYKLRCKRRFLTREGGLVAISFDIFKALIGEILSCDALSLA